MERRAFIHFHCSAFLCIKILLSIGSHVQLLKDKRPPWGFVNFMFLNVKAVTLHTKISFQIQLLP